MIPASVAFLWEKIEPVNPLLDGQLIAELYTPTQTRRCTHGWFVAVIKPVQEVSLADTLKWQQMSF